MDYKNRFKAELFATDNRSFNEKALELFRYQAKNNPVYSSYLQLRHISPDKVRDIKHIPFLPIEFFKSHRILSGDNPVKTVFYSSGTTGQARSSHHITDPQFYLKVAEAVFQKVYGALSGYIIPALLPSYLENKNSSLIYMVKDFMEKTGHPLSAIVTPEEFTRDLPAYRSSGRKILLFGVTYSLLELAENFKPDLSDFIIVETGGMKGRREELTREALHEILQKNLHTENIHSEYGMTELLSQAYSIEKGIFSCPPWMKVLLREINDPFEISTDLRSGGINIIDLANTDSCAFIETQDLGRMHEDGKFEVLGRFDNAEARGCSMLWGGNNR